MEVEVVQKSGSRSIFGKKFAKRSGSGSKFFLKKIENESRGNFLFFNFESGSGREIFIKKILELEAEAFSISTASKTLLLRKKFQLQSLNNFLIESFVKILLVWPLLVVTIATKILQAIDPIIANLYI